MTDDMFGKTVTIYHKTDSIWSRRVIDGVYIDELTGESIRKRGIASTSKVVVVIPTASGSGLLIKEGDLIVIGKCETDIVKSSKEILTMDSAYLITSADYFDYGGQQQHWEVTAK